MNVTGEPDHWLVVFHTEPRGLCRFVPGRFKHVSALAYIAENDQWLLYDVGRNGTHIAVIAGSDFADWRDKWRGAVFVQMRKVKPGRLFFPMLGLSCVMAVKHLIGLRGCVGLPDGLWRCCLRNGGTVIHGFSTFPAASDSRAGFSGAEATGAGHTNLCA